MKKKLKIENFHEVNTLKKCGDIMEDIYIYIYIYIYILVKKKKTPTRTCSLTSHIKVFVEILGMLSLYHSFLISFSVEILGMFRY